MPMTSDFFVVIPARYESQRLPGKPLIKIAGKEMLLRTWERTIEAVPRELVWIATDHQKIKEVCEAAGAQVAITSDKCLTGTDRLYEFVRLHPHLKFVINVQGDEPIINPEDIKLVMSNAVQAPDVIWNGMAPVSSEAEWRSRSVPKVVVGSDNQLLYMSRSPIPGNKTDTFEKGWKQICVYSFPVNALLKFGEHREKTELEAIEDIEILRFLELGFEVRMLTLSGLNRAVDTLDDLAAVERQLRSADATV